MIIDYHSHIGWDSANNLFLSDALMDDMKENDIDIRMASALYGYATREQNDAAMKAAQKEPRILACAVINPKERGCVAEMERVSRSGAFKAVELDSLEHSYYPEEAPNIDSIIELAVSHGLVVNCFTGWGPRTMPAQWAYYAKRHPRMKMVLLHMGTTDFGYGCIDLAKQYDNIWLETSGMYEFPILRKAFASLPKEKFLFGTHYPHKFSRCSIDTFDLLDLPGDLREHLFFKNAKTLLSL